MAGISEAQVHEAMRQLMGAGTRLSAHTIREQLGNTGSLSTIEKYRATFQSTPPSSLADLVRDEIARASAQPGVLATLEARMAAMEANHSLIADAVTVLTTGLNHAERRIDELETQSEKTP